MREYVLRRILRAGLVLFLFTIMIFAFFYYYPMQYEENFKLFINSEEGKTVRVWGERLDSDDIAYINRQLGWDTKPFPIAYLGWMGDIIRGKFGPSFPFAWLLRGA